MSDLGECGERLFVLEDLAEFDLTGLGEENVVRTDVAVGDILRCEVGIRTEEGVEEIPYLPFTVGRADLRSLKDLVLERVGEVFE